MKTNHFEVPSLPGVYIFKDAMGTIIYVGKAKSLRSRVRSYFNKQDDWKVHELIKEHATISHIVTKTEAEALLLEAQLIRDFKPKYNTLLKSGNPFLYLLFTPHELKIVRVKKEKGSYYGPFLHKRDARAVYDYLVRTFRLQLCKVKLDNGCLDYHLGRCPGSCLPTFNQTDHQIQLMLAEQALEGNYHEFLATIDGHIATYNQHMAFEKSAHLHTYRANLDIIFSTLRTKYHERKYAPEIVAATAPIDQIKQHLKPGLEELRTLLNLPVAPRSIDCFDISHFQSTHLVGSSVRFTDGQPDRNNFRRFKIKTLQQQNDYAALVEVVTRRYRDGNYADIVLIDGGRGQLNAVRMMLPNIPCISLAKREEELYIPGIDPIKLDKHTALGQLLIALRDYAHHFAITYHKLLTKKGIRGHGNTRTTD